MQSAPSNKAYAQGLAKLKELTRKYATIKTRSTEQLSAEIQATLQEIAKASETNLTLKYKEVSFGEIPNSFEINQFLETLTQDINVLIDENDILKAASIYTHNFIKMELLKNQEQNERLHNKIKTLQMYGGGEDASIVYAGDFFYNDDYIDWDLTPPSQRMELIKGDQLTLGVSSQKELISPTSEVKIEDGSNGIPGNNQQVFVNQATILFVQEDKWQPIKTQLRNIVDQQPSTVFEFEKYEVPQIYRNKAKNLNFEYSLSGSDDTKYLSSVVTDSDSYDWGNGPEGGILHLSLLVDLKSIETINMITFDPFGLTDNLNPPLLIKSVNVSNDKSNWIALTPENVWVANGIDQNTISLDSDNIVINRASFRANAEKARYIKFEIDQPKPMMVEVGHFFYVNEEADTEEEIEIAERFEGPVPPVDRIWQEKDSQSSYQNSLVQRRESFPAKRWAISIRGVSALSTQYVETSSVVSKRFDIPGGVDRVSLDADIEIPNELETNTAWVRFFISPDDGNSWHQISRIQDDFLGIPEIIAYNDNTPQELRIPGVKYYETSQTPTSLRVKIEMDRPTGDNTITPVVKSYKLKVKRRS